MALHSIPQSVVDAQPKLANLAAFLCGMLLMLSFAPVGWYWLAPVILTFALYCFVELVPRRAAYFGFWFGAGLFLAGTYWLYISIHIFGQAPLVIAMFLMLCLVFIMGLYYAACGWLINRFSRNGAWLLLVAPAIWTFDEWVRGWFLSGFPWMSLGYGQIDSPLAGFAPVTGIYGVSFLTLLSSTALVLAMKKPRKSQLILLLVAASPWLIGIGLQTIAWTKPDGTPLRATIIQGGVSQDRKWLREQFEPTLRLYRDSIAQHAESDLLVWPEVAIPAAKDQVQEYVDALQADILATGQTLLFGILERASDPDRVYNSAFVLDGNSEQVYRKRHLVPFGEYFPVPAFVREWMRMMSLPYTDISAGSSLQPLLSTSDGHQLAVAICYEDAYGSEQLYALPDADILINISNDAWFGDSIAPHQHLEIARMRALEAGRHVIRATNNGISAFIGPDGEVFESGAQFTYVSMTREVTPYSGLTPYARLGNWPVIGLCLIIIALAWVRRSAR